MNIIDEMKMVLEYDKNNKPIRAIMLTKEEYANYNSNVTPTHVIGKIENVECTDDGVVIAKFNFKK